jgi:hypothetical protein
MLGEMSTSGSKNLAVLLPPAPLKFPERFDRINFAGRTPVRKLRNIHPTLGSFTVVNHDVADAKPLAQLALRQRCLFPHLPQHTWELSVAVGLQRLRHAGTVHQKALVSV